MVAHARDPHWERGCRCLGFWRGATRIAVVYFPPRRRFKQDHPGAYSFRYDRPDGHSTLGAADSLKTAKQIVECLDKAWRGNQLLVDLLCGEITNSIDTYEQAG